MNLQTRVFKFACSLSLSLGAFVTLTNCATSSETSSLQVESTGMQRLKTMGLALYALGPAERSDASKALEKSGLELSTHHDYAEVLSKKMDNMTGQKVTPEDKVILQYQGKLFLSFFLINQKLFSHAKTVAKEILNAKMLSVQTYRWALSAYSIATLLESEKEEFEFARFQTSQCKDLCDSPGWVDLSTLTSDVFSQNWYNTQVYSTAHFRAAGVTRPKWFTDTLSTKTPDVQNVANDVAPPFVQMQTLLKVGKTNDAIALARKHNPFNASVTLKECFPNNAMAAHLLGQSRRRVQDREQFLKYQERLVELVTVTACKDADFL